MAAKRLRSVLLVPDVHAPYHDRNAWDLMFSVAIDLRPDVIVCIGDFADCYSVSSFSKDPTRVASLKDELAVCKELRAQLDSLGASEKVFIEGNHCDRLRRYLQDKAPELFGTVDIPTLLGLTENGWQHVPYKDHVRRGAVHYTHDTGHAGRYAAYRSLDTYQHSVVTGHTHRLAYIVEGNAVGECKLSAQFGWLGDASRVDYMQRASVLKNWALGFGVGYEDSTTGHCFWQPVPIVDYRCVVNGKLYRAPRLRRDR